MPTMYERIEVLEKWARSIDAISQQLVEISRDLHKIVEVVKWEVEECKKDRDEVLRNPPENVE